MGYYTKAKVSDALFASKKHFTSSTRIVLETLAHFCNDDTGACYPSIDTISSTSQLSRSTVCRALKSLVKGGMIEIHKEDIQDGYKRNTYKIRVSRRRKRRFSGVGKCQKNPQTNNNKNTLACVSVVSVREADGSSRAFSDSSNSQPDDKPSHPGLRGVRHGSDPFLCREGSSKWYFVPSVLDKFRSCYPLNDYGARRLAENPVSCALEVVGETTNRVTKNALTSRFNRLGRDAFEAEVMRLVHDMRRTGISRIRNPAKMLLWRLDKSDLWKIGCGGRWGGRADFDYGRIWESAVA